MNEPSRTKRIVVPVVAVVVLLAVWEGAIRVGLIPNFMLPSPTQIFAALVKDFSDLMYHAGYTLVEAIGGLAIGSLLGFVTALLMDRFQTFELAISPIITISQTIPSVAIAPVLVLWFGYGMMPKIILVVISTFFPVTMNMVSALRAVDQDAIDLMRTMKASELQIFRYVKLPSAASAFFSGLRISAAWAILGAVIAEWLGGVAGMGVYMTRVRKSFSYDRMFAVVLLISGVTLFIMWLVNVLEWVALPWQRKRNSNSAS